MRNCKICGLEMQEITSAGFDGNITYHVMCPHCKDMIPVKNPFKSIASAIKGEVNTSDGRYSRRKRSKKNRKK